MTDCIICGTAVEDRRGYHNALPLAAGQCCDTCNAYVTAYRMVLTTERRAAGKVPSDFVAAFARMHRMADALRTTVDAKEVARRAGVHIASKDCWCQPVTVEDYHIRQTQ